MKRIFLFFIVLIILIGVVFLLLHAQTKKLTLAEIVTKEEPTGETVVQSHSSYALQIASDTSNLKPDAEKSLTYKIVDNNGQTVKNFSLNHKKLMHLIIVRSDLQNFQHLHPTFNKGTGEFSIPIIFNDFGTYRLFADYIPAQGQQGPDGQYLDVVSSQDVNVGDMKQTRLLEVKPDTQKTKAIADYEMTYSFPQPLEANKPASIVISVANDGKPVKDLQEYLGAQAHGILLKKDTLAYAHLHAMGEEMSHEMDGKMMSMHGSLPKGPEIKFDYTFPEPGVYKLFTQFQHKNKIITSDYTFEVN